MESSVFGIHSVESRKIFFGCALFGESENRFLILDLPDFSVERNAKSEINFNLGNLSQTRTICMTASQEICTV